MSESQGFFTKPWQGGDADPAASGAGAAAASDPLAGYPSLDVSAAAEAQIAALAVDPATAGWPVWQQALTCISQGFAKCDILEVLAQGSRDDRAPAAMAAEMTRERADLEALQRRYQQLCDDYEASVERANEIIQAAHQDAMAQEAKRQAIRAEVAKAQQDQAQADWKAGVKRADDAHKAYIESLTNKYWSSM